MLRAVPTAIASPRRREPRVHPGSSKTCTLFTAPPTTQGIASGGEHMTSHGNPFS